MRSIIPSFIGIALGIVLIGCRAAPHRSEGSAKTEPVAEAGAKPPINVGFIISLTGNYSALGSEDKKAVELAVEQVNEKGGLLGRPVRLITENDRSQPEQAVLAFNALKGGDVAAIIGPVYSNAALVTGPLADRERIPYLSLAPAAEQVEPIKPYVFVVPALTGTFGERYLQYMQAQHIKKIAIAYDSKSAYAVAGHTAMTALAPKYGVEIVKREEFETTTADFSAIFTHVRATAAQALVLWATGAPGVIAAKQYAASGLKTPLFLTASQASKLWLNPVGPAAEGMTVISAIGVVGEYLPAGPQKQVIDQMALPYSQKHGYSPPQFAQDGYSACLLLFEAIKKAGSSERAKIQQALEQMTLITPNGKFKYTPNDHSGLTPDFISVNVVKAGKLVPTEWARQQLEKTVAAE